MLLVIPIGQQQRLRAFLLLGRAHLILLKVKSHLLYDPAVLLPVVWFIAVLLMVELV